MQRLLNRLLVAAAGITVAGSAWGFSMQGPLAPWQTPRLGYDINVAMFGGPMGITEEYRWNVPEVFYAFTPEFVQYFGARGVEEIDKVFQQLNNLPPASTIYDNLDKYPLRSARANYQAAALGLADLRSYFAGMALESIGLANPIRWMYTLRGREPLPTTTNYFVIRRNYDPYTWRTTPYVNGTLWWYYFVGDIDPTHSIAWVEPVDPLDYYGSQTTPVTSTRDPNYGYTAGSYWTTLTRDDMGGIHYIYRKDNYNIETLDPVITYVSGGTWGAPPGATNVGGTNFLVTSAIRPGRDHIKFRRADFDSLFGFYVPFTNRFEDAYITNGSVRKQFVERPLLAPDILIHAADVGGDETLSGAIGYAWSYLVWTYGNTNTAGGTNVTGGGVNLGPGSINPAGGIPALTVTFSTLGELWWNVYPLDQMDQIGATHILTWGSFDGTTNEPLIYPIGREVREVESLVLRGRSVDPWGAPPNSGIVTNNPGTGGGNPPTVP